MYTVFWYLHVHIRLTLLRYSHSGALLTFCNWLLSPIAFSGGARGAVVASKNICQLPPIPADDPPAFQNFTPPILSCHVTPNKASNLYWAETTTLFLVLLLFIHKNIPWMIIQLIACFGILHSSSFDLAGLIQPILSMFYFEKDQNAQNLTQINKSTTGTNSFYREKIHKKCSGKCQCFDIIVFKVLTNRCLGSL